MRRVTLLEELEQYRPWNEQEERDRTELLRRLRSGEDLYTRDNSAGHLTASAWVVSPDRRQVLMAYHNIYDSWSWLGGHADGDRDLLAVAAREVREESGLTAVRPVSRSIYSVEILTVDGHEKRGAYVSSHLHLNVTYLLEADPADPVRCKPDENSRVGWFGLEEAVAASSEPWFRERVYQKLNEKLAQFPPERAL
ncbi:MAG TPA: NUDIX hydrolase [Candidatus Oscillibacter excrementigallinarum]|uniref:NUDIX hydrolase n=1 Tax=Candidatus Oscillibacter excrementigallinarum TaxID=2838716 RepID=A0A9D2RS08_9FIRM|nr:NUDIX hydrolase [Candidatus Oscillibacter excrementigallinarum]